MHRFVAICEFKLEFNFGNTKFGKNRRIFGPRDLWIWRMTPENNKVPFLYHYKLCVPFRSHLWIRAGVTIRKCPNWGKICFYLCDLHLWPLLLIFFIFAWISLLSMVISSKNFMMIYDDRNIMKRVCQTDETVHRAAGSQLKNTYKMNKSVTSWLHVCSRAQSIPHSGMSDICDWIKYAVSDNQRMWKTDQSLGPREPLLNKGNDH